MKLAAPAAELEQLTPHNHQALSFGLPRDSAVPGQPLRPTRDSVEPQLGVGTPVAQRCRRSPLPPAAPRHRPALCLELSSVLKGRQGAPCPGRMGLPPVPLQPRIDWEKEMQAQNSFALHPCSAPGSGDEARWVFVKLPANSLRSFSRAGEAKSLVLLPAWLVCRTNIQARSC